MHFFDTLYSRIKQQEGEIALTYLVGIIGLGIAHLYAHLDPFVNKTIPGLLPTMFFLAVTVFGWHYTGGLRIGFKKRKAEEYKKVTGKDPGRFEELSALATAVFTILVTRILAMSFALTAWYAVFEIFLFLTHLNGIMPVFAVNALIFLHQTYFMFACLTIIFFFIHALNAYTWKYTHRWFWKTFKL